MFGTQNFKNTYFDSQQSLYFAIAIVMIFKWTLKNLDDITSVLKFL